MKISLIIPCFNEAPRLPKTLHEIADFRKEGSHQDYTVTEVIVVDDGSTDSTINVAKEWSASLPIRVLQHERNLGKGAALRTGVMQATGNCVLLFDADSATPISELSKFCSILDSRAADIIIGCRVPQHVTNVTVRMSLHRKWIGRAYHMITAMLIPGIADAACGFKLLETKKAKELFVVQRINRFAYDIEILAGALHRKWTVVEIPVNWNAVPISKVRIFRDGIEMFMRIMQLYLWKARKKGVFAENPEYGA